MSLLSLTPTVRMEAAALPFRLKIRRSLRGADLEVILYHMTAAPHVSWMEVALVPEAAFTPEEEKNFCAYLSEVSRRSLDRMCRLAYLVSRQDSP